MTIALKNIFNRTIISHKGRYSTYETGMRSQKYLTQPRWRSKSIPGRIDARIDCVSSQNIYIMKCGVVVSLIFECSVSDYIISKHIERLFFIFAKLEDQFDLDNEKAEHDRNCCMYR